MLPKKIKQIASVPKKVATHVVRNRAQYGFAVGVIVGGKIMRDLDSETYKEAIAFIKLKGLDTEFFNPMEHDWQDMV